MTGYRAIGMPYDAAQRLRRAAADDFGNAIIDRSGDAPAPCRFTLQDRPPGSRMRLLAWAVPEPRGVYGLVSPIFLSIDGGEPWDADNVVPPIVANRQVALRAYGSDGMMIYHANRLVLDRDHEAAIRHALGLPGVAYVNVHTALAGCYLCRMVAA